MLQIITTEKLEFGNVAIFGLKNDDYQNHSTNRFRSKSIYMSLYIGLLFVILFFMIITGIFFTRGKNKKNFFSKTKIKTT